MNVDIDNITERLREIHNEITRAVEVAELDANASAALQGAVQALFEKSEKALEDLNDASEHAIHEFITELEQAAENAKTAADVEPRIKGNTRKAILRAQDSLSLLKTDTEE